MKQAYKVVESNFKRGYEPRYFWGETHEDAMAQAMEQGRRVFSAPEFTAPIVPEDYTPLLDKCPEALEPGGIYDPTTRPTFWALAPDHLQTLRGKDREEAYRKVHNTLTSHRTTVVLTTIGSPFGRGRLQKTSAQVSFNVVERKTVHGLVLEKRQLCSFWVKEHRY